MNQNQIAKCFKKSKAHYFADEYSKLLDEARMVKVSFRDLINSEDINTQYSDFIKNNNISLPFGNIMFHVYDYPMLSMKTGEISRSEFTIHVIPSVVTFKDHNLMTMVVTDIRVEDKEPTTRSYVMYADLAGLHIMTAVDKASAAGGCECFKQNVFSTEPGLALQFLTRTPGFTYDAGLALPDCSGTAAGCAPIIACKTEMATLIKLLLAYANLPTNMFVRVVKREEKHRERYYIICDDAQWSRLKSGDLDAELYGNKFTDGSKLKDSFILPVIQNYSEELTIGNKVFTPTIRSDDDETGTSTQDHQEGDDGNGTSLGADISKNAS